MMDAKRYRTIVADPPWEMARHSGYAWREGTPSGSRQHLDYGTLSVPTIQALPVRDIAAVDAHLFVWTTQRHLEQTYGVARGWGFVPSCVLVWCKAPHGWGPGGVFQSTVEFVVYARRGKPQPNSHVVTRQWWEWPRSEHSAKPEAFLDLIEEHFPAPRLEMFARRDRLGWDTWGNESLGTAVLGDGQ
jgi:N6-adenosine-specific RNA methylase IME4